MTLVRVKVSVPEVLGLEPAGGAIRWTPTKRRLAGDTVVMPKGFSVPLVNGEADIELSPTSPDWVWRVDEQVPGANNKSLYLAVPDLEEIAYTDLIEVDPATLVPTADPDPAWYAYVDTLEGQAATASASAVSAKNAAEAAQLSATGSETSAAASAATATTKATEAGTSAFNAGNSAAAALGHKNDAAASAGAAANSATSASNSASAANVSAVAAADSELTATEMAELAQSSASDTIAAANGFSIGTVTTGTPGSPATATITGDAPNKKLNLGLPKGETGPANTLTVLETVTGPETPGATGPQGLKGDKGDPGGFTAGTDLTTANLNDITTPGLYRQGASANATLVNNYPIAGVNGTGTLEVIQQGTTPATGTLQRYTPVWGNQTGKVIFVRTLSNSVWSTWTAQASNRIDQAAGRVIYAWDYLNAREQRIYGDTGWRTVTPTPNATVTSGTVRYRRVGDQVYLRFVDLLLSSGANGFGELIPSADVPVGFRPNSAERSMQNVGQTNNATYPQVISIYSAIGWVYQTVGITSSLTRPTSPLQGTVSWVTDEAWPTTLPGTAFGSIPNL